MRIFVNNKLSAIKEGSTFEYVQENRLFTEAEGYSLEIEFPLRGCLQNQQIFGLLNLVNATLPKYPYQCIIEDVGFRKVGQLTITAVNDICVKAQFLEGASAANYAASSLDTTYINEVRVLTAAERTNPPAAPVLSCTTRSPKLLTLPWVNNYSGNMQNRPVNAATPNEWWEPSDGDISNGIPAQSISYQIMMSDYLARLASASGIPIDVSALDEKWKQLVIANACPGAWHLDDICYALPHWTVREFLDELALFTGGVFIYDFTSGTATYRSVKQLLEADPIDLDRVVDAYEMEVSDDAAKNYAGAVSLKYADCGHRMWKYYDCQWLIDYALRTGQYVYGDENTIKSICQQGEGDYVIQDEAYWRDAESPSESYRRAVDLTKMVINKSTGRAWIVTSFKTTQGTFRYSRKGTNKKGTVTYTRYYDIRYRELNRFRPAQSDATEVKELRIVPVWLDDTEAGQVVFLDHGEFGDDSGTEELPLNAMLSSGEQSPDSEFLDKLYVGFIPGYGTPRGDDHAPASGQYKRLTNHGLERTDIDRKINESFPTVNPNRKYKIKFLSKTIPDVNGIFLIRGRRFLCSQLSTTFTTDGRSELVKGEFFVIDD